MDVPQDASNVVPFPPVWSATFAHWHELWGAVASGTPYAQTRRRFDAVHSELEYHAHRAGYRRSEIDTSRAAPPGRVVAFSNPSQEHEWLRRAFETPERRWG